LPGVVHRAKQSQLRPGGRGRLRRTRKGRQREQHHNCC